MFGFIFNSQSDTCVCYSSSFKCFLVCAIATSKDPCSSSHPDVCNGNTLRSMVRGNAYALREDSAILSNTIFKEIARRDLFYQEHTAMSAVVVLLNVAVVTGDTSFL